MAKAKIKAEKAEQQAKKKAEQKERSAAKKAEQKEKKAQAQAKKAEKKAQAAQKKAQAAQKKAQDVAAKAEKAAAAKAAEGEGGGKKKKGGKKKLDKKKLLILVAGAAVAGGAVFFLLNRGSKDKEPAVQEPIQPPAAYILGQGETPVPALPLWGEGVLVYQDPVEPPPPPETEDGKDTEDGKTAEVTAVAYRYEGLTAPAGLVSAYAAFLTAEDVGFQLVDDTLTTFPEEEQPDLEAVQGSVLLAREAPAEADADKVLTLAVDWTETNCTVTADAVEGRIHHPTPPRQEGGGMMPAQMTLAEAQDFFQGLDPAVLGLEGDSMDDYTVYSVDGAVTINGIPCMRMNVYRSDPGGVNQLAGNFFLSSDGLHIYQLDVAADRVTELELPH